MEEELSERARRILGEHEDDSLQGDLAFALDLIEGKSKASTMRDKTKALVSELAVSCVELAHQIGQVWADPTMTPAVKTMLSAAQKSIQAAAILLEEAAK